MTPVSSVNLRPLLPAKLAEAPVNAPVCSHTMTGAGSTTGGLLTQIFSVRQFSFPDIDPVVPKNAIEGHPGGGVVACNNDGVHGVGGCGGFQRFSPPVGAAYGMPRKAQEVPESTPWTSPAANVTRHGTCRASSPVDPVTDPMESMTVTPTRLAPIMPPAVRVISCSSDVNANTGRLGRESLQKRPKKLQNSPCRL